MKRLKLFVWEDVLKDYTAGLAFALAHTLEEAHAEIKKFNGFVPDDILTTPPQIYPLKPRAFLVYGGG